MNMSEFSNRLLCRTLSGKVDFKSTMASHVIRLVVGFLRSRWSKPLIRWYVWRHDVQINRKQLRRYRSFRDFFAREGEPVFIDPTPGRLISPCDGWIRACLIDAEGRFSVRDFDCHVRNLIDDAPLAEQYKGSLCLVVRIDPSDCHRYCYIDDAYLWQNHRIAGSREGNTKGPFPAHSRLSWCLMTTRNFGPVVQVEICAQAYGSIVNNHDSGRVWRGNEKGHFELAGSTVVMLFEANQIRMTSDIRRASEANRSLRVRRGMVIGSKTEVKE